MLFQVAFLLDPVVSADSPSAPDAEFVLRKEDDRVIAFIGTVSEDAPFPIAVRASREVARCGGAEAAAEAAVESILDKVDGMIDGLSVAARASGDLSYEHDAEWLASLVYTMRRMRIDADLERRPLRAWIWFK